MLRNEHGVRLRMEKVRKGSGVARLAAKSVVGGMLMVAAIAQLADYSQLCDVVRGI